MPFLNLTTGILIYADSNNVENPKIRLADTTDIYQQIVVSNALSMETVIEPGEAKTIISTQKTITASSTTQFTVSRPVLTEDIARFEWTGTGTNPTFRQLRALGLDNTSHIALVRVGPRAMKVMSISGTSLNTSAVQTGDHLWFEKNTDSYTSPLSSYNTDKLFIVQSKGTGYVVINDEGVLGEEADVNLNGYSTTPSFKIFVQPDNTKPKVSDYITITADDFNFYNAGSFQILRITDKYVEYLNPYLVEETVTNTNTGLVIFDYFIRFINIVSSGEIQLSIDDNTAFSLEKLNDNSHAQFTGTLKATKITATNDKLDPVIIRCQFAGVV